MPAACAYSARRAWVPFSYRLHTGSPEPGVLARQDLLERIGQVAEEVAPVGHLNGIRRAEAGTG
jgi:hypothetical protein